MKFLLEFVCYKCYNRMLIWTRWKSYKQFYMSAYTGVLTALISWIDCGKRRCCWAKPKNERYIRYHDEEWGVPVHDDHKLFEMLVLECFQAGLSWECVLNKREAFREAFDGFDLEAVCDYGEEKMTSLRSNAGIIRNRLKIQAAVTNARTFRAIQEEYGSFAEYLWRWTDGRWCMRRGGRSQSFRTGFRWISGSAA